MGTENNATWLAGKLGITKQRVSQLKQQEEWRWGDGPYNIAQAKQIKAWIDDKRALNNAASSVFSEDEDAVSSIDSLARSPERVAKIKLIIERTAKIKLEREMLAGGFVRKEEVERIELARVYS